MKFVRFGLIVTGKGESEFLPRLFRSIIAHANCQFEIVRQSRQLSPKTAPAREIRIGGKRSPTIDEEQFGLPALAFLRRHKDSFVIVIDDMERARREIAEGVFGRYRGALDQVLRSQGLSSRASVHFLVNMLEAYYFADSVAVNKAAGTTILADDHSGDVEEIHHPKNDLKALWSGFDEVDHGRKIIEVLNLEHVLRTPEHCCWLRAMFSWCVERLRNEGVVWSEGLYGLFRLPDGTLAKLTAGQLTTNAN